MSIDITIVQKGWIKKKLPLSVILGDHLSYGKFDGVRLIMDEVDETEFLAYNPQQIGRGFSVEWTESETNTVSLRGLTPTTPEELRDFQSCIARICKHWKSTLLVDGEETTLEDFLDRYEELVQFNQGTLRSICEEVVEGKHAFLTLLSACIPFIIGKDEATRFLQEDGYHAFGECLHQRQSLDAYFATPRFYRMEGVSTGVYVLTEDVRSLFPRTPKVMTETVDTQTGEPFVPQNWVVYLYSTTREYSIGSVPYDQFLAHLPAEKVSAFDPQTLLIENLTLTEMEHILNP